LKNFIAAYIENRNKLPIYLLTIIGLVIFGYGLYSLTNPYILIEWSTASEVDTLGFNLIRAELNSNDASTQVNQGLIFSQGSPISGYDYSIKDTSVQIGKEYNYSLQEVNYSNEISELERVTVASKPQGIPTMLVGLFVLALSLIIRNFNFIQVKK